MIHFKAFPARFRRFEFLSLTSTLDAATLRIASRFRVPHRGFAKIEAVLLSANFFEALASGLFRKIIVHTIAPVVGGFAMGLAN